MSLRLFFLLLLLPLLFPASEVAAQQTIRVSSYDELVRAIRETRAETKERIAEAVQQEKVREAWTIGKLILEHVLLNEERADYGKEVYKRLSHDLAMSVTEIQYMVEFARSYPIYPAPGILSWAHYRELLSVNDAAQRAYIAKKSIEHGWNQKELRREIKKLKASAELSDPNGDLSSLPDWQAGPNDFIGDTLPQIEPGKPGVYRIVDWNGKKAYDLGFTTYLEIEGPLPGSPEPAPAELYTYEAQVVDVIDGDTFWADLRLGFGVGTRQKLRLRGIDAPEPESREGREATQFLKTRFAAANHNVLVRTVKSDKYDRYLSDVWVNGVYLNQQLLDEGLVVRVGE